MMTVKYQSVSHRCTKCGYMVDPEKSEVEAREVERLDNTLGLQYDHADECPSERAAAYNRANPTYIQGSR